MVITFVNSFYSSNVHVDPSKYLFDKYNYLRFWEFQNLPLCCQLSNTCKNRTIFLAVTSSNQPCNRRNTTLCYTIDLNFKSSCLESFILSGVLTCSVFTVESKMAPATPTQPSESGNDTTTRVKWQKNYHLIASSL